MNVQLILIRFARNFTPVFLVIIAYSTILPGCLKTRSQVREEQAYPAADQQSSDATAGSGGGNTGQSGDAPQGQGGSYAVDELKSEFIHVVGRVEDLERNAKQNVTDQTEGKALQAAHETRIKELETRLSELENAQATLIESVKRIEESKSHVSKAETGSLLEKGKKEYLAQDYGGAIETLSVYIRALGEKANEDAYYFRGQSFYQSKDYKKAILDFSKFPEKFSKSKRMPEVLFRIGSSFEEMGMKDDSKTFYQELVEKFPKSPEAKKAKGKIR